jgi:hypothetical protein
MAKFLIISGIILLGIGLLVQFSHKIPFLGKLPGDIIIERQNFKLYFPVTTSILLSILVSVILLLINRAKH